MSGAELVAGAWDTHVHAAPSLFPRWGNHTELVDVCAAAGLAGVVLKAHHGSTVEVAGNLAGRQAGLRVLGGVVLNGFVGGLNPLAVEASIALGGRIVWLPTIHARHHGSCIGLGGFSFHAQPLAHTPTEGIAVIGEDGVLVAAMHDILDLLDGSGVVLATGHVSAGEIAQLSAAIGERKLDVRLLINHAFYTVPSLEADQLRMLVAPTTYFETCYLSASPLGSSSFDRIAAGLKAVPEAQWILASDSGQPQNPPAPAALARFADELLARGVAAEALRSMLRDHPRQLFGIGE